MPGHYRSLDDLPREFYEVVLRVGEPDAVDWVLEPIPALGGRSIIETMNEPSGPDQVRVFLQLVIGKFA